MCRLRRLVEQQRPAAAFLMDARWDLVCWNDLADALLGFHRAAPRDRNVAWLMFADTGYGAVLDDRDPSCPRSGRATAARQRTTGR